MRTLKDLPILMWELVHSDSPRISNAKGSVNSAKSHSFFISWMFEAMNHIVPYCSVSSTRHQLFEANITVSGSDILPPKSEELAQLSY